MVPGGMAHSVTPTKLVSNRTTGKGALGLASSPELLGSLGAPANHASHRRSSKWLIPALWLAPALTSMAICLHLPSLGLAATSLPAPSSSAPGSSVTPASLACRF